MTSAVRCQDFLPWTRKSLSHVRVPSQVSKVAELHNPSELYFNVFPPVFFSNWLLE